MTLAAALCVSAAEDAATTERALAQVVDELNALDAWLDDARKRLSSLQREIAAADKDIAAMGRRIRDLDAELALTQASLLRLTSDRKDLESRRVTQAQRIGRHVREAYRLTGQDFFKLLLNQESPDTFDRTIRYHGYFSKARLAALDEYQHTLVAIDANERATVDRSRVLADQQDELARRQKLLVAERQGRETLIDALRAEVSDNTALRDKLEADRHRLETLLAEIKRLAEKAEATRFAQNKGQLGWPIAGKLVHRYGQPRAGGRLKWEGMYFQAPTGAEVTAIHTGRVVFADWLRGFGLLTIIDHGDDNMSLYGNADVLFKQVGDWVESGEAIAAAGRSGGQAESGLYFEVRTKGRPTNPIAWLQSTRPR